MVRWVVVVPLAFVTTFVSIVIMTVVVNVATATVTKPFAGMSAAVVWNVVVVDCPFDSFLALFETDLYVADDDLE